MVISSQSMKTTKCFLGGNREAEAKNDNNNNGSRRYRRRRRQAFLITDTKTSKCFSSGQSYKASMSVNYNSIVLYLLVNCLYLWL